MPTIIFAWELGENLGHISSLLPFALEFKQRGWEPVFVVRDTNSAALLLGPHGIAYFQAPIFIGARADIGMPPRTYAEILLHCGYATPNTLTGLLVAWRNLLRLIGPDVTVFDHSPTALLASRADRTIKVLLSSGFFIPPSASPFPSIVLDQHIEDEALAPGEERLLATINAAMQSAGLDTIPSLHSLLESDATYLQTFEELDHYGARAGAVYWGGLYLDDLGCEAQWPSPERQRIFVYLRPHNNGFERLLSQLRLSGCDVLVYAPGVDKAVVDRYGKGNVAIMSTPLKMSSITPHCDLAILYAGHATMSAFLMAGVPMLLLPQHPEQTMVAQRAVAIGAAICVDAARADVNFLPSIAQLLSDQKYRDAAQRFARKYSSYDARSQASVIADEICSLVQHEVQALRA